jgi:hypothetical protein
MVSVWTTRYNFFLLFLDLGFDVTKYYFIYTTRIFLEYYNFLFIGKILRPRIQRGSHTPTGGITAIRYLLISECDKPRCSDINAS